MSGVGLSFILLERAEYPDAPTLITAAAELGLTLSHEPSDEGPAHYELEGGVTLMVMLMDAPHPDAPHMPAGLASPDEAQLEQVSAHYIVTMLDGPQDPRVADPLLASLTAAVVRASPAIAAMLGHGVAFHRAEFFVDAVEGSEGALPMLVCVDVTTAPEGEDRMSFLTHGLDRYGREEFFITASRTGNGAVDFLLGLVGWMIDDPDKHLPTGDTVGRSAEETVEIQRVPSPLAGPEDESARPEVICLDLDLP